MRVKYAKDIIKEIQARGSIQVPEGYITGEAFEEWVEGKERFGMSISEQVKELRETAELFDKIDDGRRMLLQAADTIEALSAKLAANMDRSDRYCGGGWISCEDRLSDKEVLCCDQCGEMILGYIAEDEGSETGFSAENDSEYTYNCVKWMEKPKP